MSENHVSAQIRCQVAVIVPATGKVLTCNFPSTRVLPSLTIARYDRACEQIQKLFREHWGLNIYLADVLWDQIVEDQALWVAEPLESVVSSNLVAVDIEDLPGDGKPSDTKARLRAWVNEDFTTKPTSRIGWIGEAQQWIEHVTADRLLPAYTIKQYNGGGGFSLLRWKALSGRSYWLKGVAEPNQHEVAITALVHNLAPNVSSLLLATRPEWHAWLMLEDGASCGSSRPSPSAAIQALVEIQGRSLTHVQDLLNRGAFDQRAGYIQQDLPIIFDYLEESMQMQESTKAPRLSRDNLDTIQDTLLYVYQELTENVPISLLHGDLSGGNVSGNIRQCRLLDWCESYIGFAPISLHHLLMLYSREGMPPADIRSKIELYSELWETGFGIRMTPYALACAPLLAAASALYGRGTWLHSPMERNRQQRRSYSRTLARHMAREAQWLKERGQLCHC